MAQHGIWRNKLSFVLLLLIFFSCEHDAKKENPIIENPVTQTPQPIVERPAFDADSAYKYVQQQVDFGPRFPNNKAHGACATFLAKKLTSFGLTTITQTGKGKTFNNKNITIKNIIGQYNPSAEKRILLFAHWDSRPFADQDTKDLTKPILGANDGASGVGILLEVARQLNLAKPKIGVDIIFFDAEDYGRPSGINDTENSAETWCLGTQYWSKNVHQPNYKAEFGILLDMVGTANLYLSQERYSVEYAPKIIQKVWNNAKILGYESNFANEQSNYITDDHVFVNEIAGIPSIDLIHYDKSRGSFHPTWHTHKDNMNIIDKSSLKTVGEVLLYTIYAEK